MSGEGREERKEKEVRRTKKLTPWVTLSAFVR